MEFLNIHGLRNFRSARSDWHCPCLHSGCFDLQHMNTEVRTEQIVKDLKTVARDAEELAAATAGEVSEKVRDARARLAQAITSAKHTCQRWEEKAVVGAKAANKVVHEHPYRVAGVALGLGVLVGVIIARK